MKTKNLIVILLLSSGVSGYAVMPVFDATTEAAVIALNSQIASFEGERVAKEEAMEALKTADKAIVAQENIQNIREIIEKINSVGKVAYSLGQNGQDMMDTVNQISDLVGGSLIFNKSIDEMTKADFGTANEEIAQFRRKSVEVLGKINNLGNDTMSRINGLWDTADAIYEAQQILGLQTIDPEYQKLRELTKYSELASRQMETLIGAINGQNMMTQIEKSLDIVEDGIRLKQQDEYNKIVADMDSNLGDLDLDKVDLILGDSSKIDALYRTQKNYDFESALNRSKQKSGSGGINIDASSW